MNGKTYPGPDLPFADRLTAGRLLGERLRDTLAASAAPGARALVLALPRGGVPVGCEVAGILRVPVDVLVTRKIGYPPQPELGVGAIAEGGAPGYDRDVLAALHLAPDDLSAVAEREHDELDRQVEVYRAGRPPPDVTGRTVVVVDDGLATGVTARAALRAVRARGAARTILAVPVAPSASVAAMRAEADEVVVLASPRRFRSVGEWYVSFGQLTDADVLSLLAQAAARPR